MRTLKTFWLLIVFFLLWLDKCKPVIAILADHLLVPSRTLWVTAFMWPEWLFSSQQKMALNILRRGILMKPRVRSITGQHLNVNIGCRNGSTMKWTKSKPSKYYFKPLTNEPFDKFTKCFSWERKSFQGTIINIKPKKSFSFIHHNLPKQFKYFRFVTDTLFHAFLHCCHDRLCLVLSSMFRTLLSRPCKTHYKLTE